ncbi:MAG: uracil-DNA glycosylase [Lentisphaeria bacterium]|jgi:uracil-DNA glycosylase
MTTKSALPPDWKKALQPFLPAHALAEIKAFLKREEKAGQVIFPPRQDIYRALVLTPFAKVKAVWLGQDPYHDDGQACGLAFSVPDDVPAPPSLRNILKEYSSDLGRSAPASPSLESWARQGVLLLNTVLTVRAHQPGSHRDCGWEKVTDAIIRALSSRRDRVLAFILLGNAAKVKTKLIDDTRHVVIQCAHPSPLSAYRGFLGSRLFTRTNQLLAERAAEPIDWMLDGST